MTGCEIGKGFSAIYKDANQFCSWGDTFEACRGLLIIGFTVLFSLSLRQWTRSSQFEFIRDLNCDWLTSLCIKDKHEIRL
jgi:hypothetical protein